MSAQLPDPLRVLHVITSTGVGGAERMLQRTLRALARVESPRVECLACSVQPLGAVGEALAREGHRVVALDARRPATWGGWAALPATEAAALLRLRALARDFRPHVVQSWLPRAGILARLAAAGLGAPVLGSARVTEPRRTALDALDGLTRGLVARWLAVSEAAADALSRSAGIPRDRFTVIPNALEEAELAPLSSSATFRARHGIPADALVVLAVGRLHAQKDHAALVTAAAAIAEPAVHLVVAGEGPERVRLEAQAAASAAAGRVHLVGTLPDVREALGASDVFALVSAFEGMSGALLEAMGQGLPSVVTDVPGTREVVTPGREALVVPRGDPAALASALGELARDPERRRALGAAARERVREAFLMPRNVERLLALHAEVLGVPARRT